MTRDDDSRSDDTPATCITYRGIATLQPDLGDKSLQEYQDATHPGDPRNGDARLPGHAAAGDPVPGTGTPQRAGPELVPAQAHGRKGRRGDGGEGTGASLGTGVSP